MKEPTDEGLALSESLYNDPDKSLTTDRNIANPADSNKSCALNGDVRRDAYNLIMLRRNLSSGIDCYNKVVRALERKYGDGFKKLVREASP